MGAEALTLRLAAAFAPVRAAGLAPGALLVAAFVLGARVTAFLLVLAGAFGATACAAAARAGAFAGAGAGVLAPAASG